MPAERYVVELTQEAEAVYTKLADEADHCTARGDETNSKVTLFRMVEDALDNLIPHDPFNKSRALTGPLSNICRVKKGRMRVCYIGSSKARRITILYISTTLRKEGDRSDPYELFTKLVASGRFDQIFGSLGVKVPHRHTK